MAITPSVLSQSGQDTSATSYTTVSVSPAAAGVTLLAAAWVKGSDLPPVPTVTGTNGLSGTWTAVNSTQGTAVKFWVFRSTSQSTTAGTLTFNFNGDTQLGMRWQVLQVAGTDVSSNDGVVQSAAATTTNDSLSLTLSAFTNATLGMFGAIDTAGGSSMTWTAGSGFTLGSGSSGVVSTERMQVIYEYRTDSDTTVDISIDAANDRLCGVAMELAIVTSPSASLSPSSSISSSLSPSTSLSPSASSSPSSSLSPSASVSPSPADTGFLSPTSTPTPGNYNGWTNPTRAYSSNDSYTTSLEDNSQQSYGTFGFNIPASVIDGIEVKLEGKSSGTSTVKVSLWSASAGQLFTHTTTQADLTTTESIHTLGCFSDLWHGSWVYTDFSDANFYLVIQAPSTGDNTASVDHLQAKVYYTLLSPSASLSPSGSRSPSSSISSSASASLSTSNSPSASVSPSISPSSSLSSSISASRSPSSSRSPSTSLSPSASISPSTSLSPSVAISTSYPPEYISTRLSNPTVTGTEIQTDSAGSAVLE